MKTAWKTQSMLLWTLVPLLLLVIDGGQSQSSADMEVRLQGGTVSSGRVEVRRNSTQAWGTVCHDSWDSMDASVVCRMLGYRWGTGHRYAHFGAGSGPIYMDNVRCRGNETSLMQCQFAGWGVHNCRHYEDAGVTCGNATFQLKGSRNSDTNYGLVQYRDATGWKPVCDSGWDDVDAKVLCRSLGYEDGSALCCNKLSPYPYNPYFYPRRSRTNFNCTGSEATILDCPNTNRSSSCSTRRIASAICYTRPKDEISMELSLQLVNGSDSSSGIVQVTRMGQAGQVCAHNWSNASAQVACRQLGFTSGVVYGGSGRYELPAWVTSVNCTGNETSLDQCVDSVWGKPVRYCTGNRVLCYRDAAPTVSLAGGGNSYGRVQITHNGVAGTVCDNSFDDNDAVTICTQLGFSAGTAISGSYYGRGTGPIYMDRLNCRRRDASIFACRNSGWRSVGPGCANHTKDASVSCFGDVKLSRGDHSHGIALVWTQSRYGRKRWSPICGTGFTDVEASVVCSQLGFQNGRTLPFGSYGRYFASYYYYYGNNVTCTGSETSILNCTTTSGSCYTRSGNGYASVACYNGTLSSNTSVALTGGTGQFADVSGRVVVTKTGIRGRICHTNWDNADAGVLCRQLGFMGGLSYIFSGSGFGPYLLPEVNCYGNESSIFDCTTGSEQCSSTGSYDAGVLCYRNQQIRVELVGGTALQGRVQITYEGVRGTICTPYGFGHQAKVICKQLGYNDGEITRQFGAGTGSIFMSNPMCSGMETSIFQCRNSGWSISGYGCQDHSKDLGVICYGNAKVTRGVTNANAASGVVQLFKTNRWRKVCANVFDSNDSTVFCRELGYTYGKQFPSVTSSRYWYLGSDPINGLNCTGSETATDQCGFSLGACVNGSRKYGTVLCTHVQITDNFPWNVTVRQNFPAVVKVFNFGITVTFCSDVFTDREARVVCRAQGYTSGVAFGPKYLYNAYPVLNVTCGGNETNLNECRVSTDVPSACSSSSYKSAQVYCTNEEGGMKVRLIKNGQPSNIAGRVEVKIGGVWGTICDSSFSNNDAKVVCRQLGYSGGYARSASFYGRGTGPNWFYRPYCTGNELTIWNCRYNVFNTTRSFCTSHRYDASVQCTGLVRLHVNNTYGAIQVMDDTKTYRLICADNFTDVDAKVVCNEVGFQYGVRVGASAFGYQRYSIGFTNVRCRGSESSIKNCPYDVSLTYCPSRKYASAACSNIVPGSGYTLSIANNDHGIVTIRHMNIDGYICPNGFDNNVATVICREKGYLGGYGYRYLNFSRIINFYRRNVNITTMRWLSGIKCDGTETYLSNCDGVRYGDTTGCSVYGEAAVYCYQTTGLQVRLGNKTGSSGRVEISVDGSWGTMCSRSWGGFYSMRGALVICRMLNYTDGRPLPKGTFGPGTGPVLLSGLYCSGNESSITQCSSRWRQASSRCDDHQNDNAVICYDNVRLAGGQDANYGRVEVYKNSQWTPVCDHNFDNAAARVVCKKLGYVDGRAQCCNAVGNINASKITFVINGCTGSEADLFACNVDTGQCATGKYATVYCANTTIVRSDPTLRFRLDSRYYGAVLINRYGFWGPICGNGWDNKDASVACKSMGYAGGIKFAGRYYTRAPMVVGKFQCTGSENNITQCPFKDLDDNVDLGCRSSSYWYSDGAGALCWNSGDGGIGIRLANATGRMGRLEISYEGEWGRVCRGWYRSDKAARVACRQLGYSDGRSVPVPRASGQRIWMHHLRCNGTEQSLFECPLKWDVRRCYSDMGVVCYNDVRIVRGNKLSTGLVQVNINNNWGSVCATDWDNSDIVIERPLSIPEVVDILKVFSLAANKGDISSYNFLPLGRSAGTPGFWRNGTEANSAPTCRGLGYNNGYKLCCGAFGRDSTSPNMGNVGCSGSETSLAQCAHSNPHSHTCESNAALACYNGTADTTLNWRLADGNNYTGEVLVDFINITGRICTDGWDDKDAKVLCRSMGYSKGQAYTHYRYTYDSNNGPLWTSNFGCTGTEDRLSDCSHSTLGSVSSCGSKHSAGVLCGDTAGIYYRLTGSDDNAGRVEVSVNGVWGSVCRSYFDNREAAVLCKTLGYNTGVADYSARYPNATGPVYEARFRCNGNESSLAMCPHAGWKTSSYSRCASHRYDAAVRCFGDVKLASRFAPSIKQGPVQAWYNNSWHYVCDTNFNDVSAKTVCKYLGFVDGKSLCCSAYGTKYVRYSWYGNGPGSLLPNMTMRCDGSQSDPMNCIVPGTCSNNYASVVCFNSTDIISESYNFTFDIPTSTKGQVAVQHYGVRGRICSTFWTDSEATVFCKSLNYDNGIAYHHSLKYNYQPIRSRGPFWISGVNCTGTESSLSACTFQNRTSLGNCSGADIASAICYNGDQGIKYRMVTPDNSTNKNYGRVEMSVGGVWGTICDRYFDRREAAVFCRLMNFTDGYAIAGAHYGQGTGPMWLSGLQCKGTETALHQCPHSGFRGEVVSGYSYYWCRSHRYDVSVYCVDKLRLNTGVNASMGAVEVYTNNKWNTVCDSGFNNAAASIVCRTLGFGYGAALAGSLFGKTEGDISISQVTCNGRESDFSKCSISSSTTCSSGTYASVVCSNNHFVDNGFQVRIARDDPTSGAHGYLEVNINGIWGSVCGTGFNDRAANIACKQQGFRGGVAYQSAVLNPFLRSRRNIVEEKRPILMTEVKCMGDEASLNMCSSKATSKTSWCDYYAPRAGVLCYQEDSIQYRLAGNTNPMQGRIEMKYDNQWGTVCDPARVANGAGVVCRSIGHTDGLQVSNVRYRIPNDNRPVWFRYLRCHGNETGLTVCPHDGFNSTLSAYRWWLVHYCRTRGPAAVKCFDNDIKVTQIRLANGPTNNTGRVEVFLQGPDQWGTVCDDYWDDKDATVVCMMLGYARGKAMMRATYGQGTGPVWMDNLGCKGTESHLHDCPHNGYAIENCLHSEDAGVQCFGTYRKPTTTSSSSSSSTTTTTSKPKDIPNKGVTEGSPGKNAGGSSGKVTAEDEAPVAAITAPIVCVVVIVAAVCGFLYYRRLKSQRLDMTTGLVPDIPASSRPRITFTSVGALFSKSPKTELEPEVSGRTNPNYELEPVEESTIT